MVQVIFLTKDGVRLAQDSLLLAFLVGLEDDVASEGELVVIEGPDMDVMDFLNAVNALESGFHFIDVQVGRHSLEDQHDTLPESQTGCPEDNDGENVGADGVDIPKLWPEENERGCDNDTY